MVECEYKKRKKGVGDERVLIDTWWNVNNDYDRRKKKVGRGFNRYMVECEL